MERKIETVEELNNVLCCINQAEDAVLFKDIAKALFNNYRIKKGNETYRMVEIEFYHNCCDKDDAKKKTYKRTTNSCEWFFHQSGVDLSFRSDDKNYGGILIRAIISNEGKLICGPMKVVDELFDHFDAINIPENFPHIIDKHINSDDGEPQVINRFNFDGKPYGYCLPEIFWQSQNDKNKQTISSYQAYPWIKGKNILKDSRNPTE